MTGIADAVPGLRWALPMLALLCMPAAVEAACPPARPVRFATGASEITLSGGIPRGERDCYTLPARKGQMLTVDANYVDSNLGNLVKDEDLSRYIL